MSLRRRTSESIGVHPFCCIFNWQGIQIQLNKHTAPFRMAGSVTTSAFNLYQYTGILEQGLQLSRTWHRILSKGISKAQLTRGIRTALSCRYSLQVCLVSAERAVEDVWCIETCKLMSGSGNRHYVVQTFQKSRNELCTFIWWQLMRFKWVEFIHDARAESLKESLTTWAGGQHFK